MANYNASVRASALGAAKDKLNASSAHAVVKYIMSTYTVPAGTLAIADTITWCQIPKGARVIGNMSKIYFSAGTASSTINLGDSGSAARFLAATSVASAGSAVPEAANASGANHIYTADTNLVSTVAGAVLAAGQVITLHLAYVQT